MQILPKKPFTWVLLGIIAYAWLTDSNVRQQQTKKDEEKKPGTITLKSGDEETSFWESPANSILKQMQKTDTGRAVVESFVEKAVKKQYGEEGVAILSARYQNDVKIIDSIAGKGIKASCGNTVTLHYDSFLTGKMKLDSTRDSSSPVTFKIGDRQVIKGLELGVIGMKQDGKRRLTIPPAYAFDDPEFKSNIVKEGQIVSYDVELLKIKDDAYKTGITSHIYDDQPGMGKKASCGSNVTIKYTLKTIKDEVIADQRQLSFTIGKGQVPIGLERGVSGMQIGGTRRIVVPNKVQIIPGKSIFDKNIKFPENQSIAFEIELVGMDE